MSGVNQAKPVDGLFAGRLAELQRAGRVSGLHALLVARGDKMLFEHYGVGEDECWGRPLGTVAFGPEVLHDLRSVTKSIVGMLYGVAFADGKVPPPEARLYEHFPEYADLAREPGRDRLTVAHVLSMTMGTDWDELTIPYGSDVRNSEIAMEMSADRYRFVLDRPIVGEPGVKWTYNGGATTLLGHLIARGTGEKLPDYARRALFDPMGLGPTEWSNGLKGEPAAASGLRMRPRDLMCVGQMVLANGFWQGRQVVPADWLRRSTSAAVNIDGQRRYGWHWYAGDVLVGTQPSAELRISGIGWGGQRLELVPALGLVVVMHFGNYRRPHTEQGAIANGLLTEVLMRSLG